MRELHRANDHSQTPEPPDAAPPLPPPGRSTLTAQLEPTAGGRARRILDAFAAKVGAGAHVPEALGAMLARVHGQADGSTADPRLQRWSTGAGPALDGRDAHAVAAEGVTGTGGALPYLERIQAAFGHHDVSGVRAHVGGAAAGASELLGAQAYAAGDRVAFATEPDLFLVAHEAAHIVQQRGGVQLAGGVGAAGDAHEQHANQVADAVVRGESAVPLLDRYAGRGGAAAGLQLMPAAEANGVLRRLASLPEAEQRRRISAWSPAWTRELLDSISAQDRQTYAAIIHRISGERTASAAERAEGNYDWVRSGPTRPTRDQAGNVTRHTDYQIAEQPSRPADVSGEAPDDEVQNDFARWVRGQGPEPGAHSTMNCWEAVFFSAYKAGVVPRSFLRSLHERAAGAGGAGGQRRGEETENTDPNASSAAGRAEYDAVLSGALGLGNAQVVTSSQALTRGDIVFFSDLAHVAVAVGGNRIMSLWCVPLNDDGTWNRRFQGTTIDEVIALMTRDPAACGVQGDAPVVKVAPCPW
jgi:hypothetical protein